MISYSTSLKLEFVSAHCENMGKRKAETAAGDEPGTSGQDEALSNVVYIGYVCDGSSCVHAWKLLAPFHIYLFFFSLSISQAYSTRFL